MFKKAIKSCLTQVKTVRLIKLKRENRTYNSKFARSDMFKNKNMINTINDFENKKNKKANNDSWGNDIDNADKKNAMKDMKFFENLRKLIWSFDS